MSSQKTVLLPRQLKSLTEDLETNVMPPTKPYTEDKWKNTFKSLMVDAQTHNIPGEQKGEAVKTAFKAVINKVKSDPVEDHSLLDIDLMDYFTADERLLNLLTSAFKDTLIPTEVVSAALNGAAEVGKAISKSGIVSKWGCCGSSKAPPSRKPAAGTKPVKK